jgi:predicted ester cyclase
MTTVNPARTAAYRVFEAINTKDLSAIDDVVTADFVDHGSPFPLPPGPAGYRQILTFVTQVLDVRYEVLDEIVTEDRIVFRALGRGRGVAAVHGAAADGKPYAMETAHFYRTEGDRLAEHWGVRDELGAMIQLGVIPSPYAAEIPGLDTVGS